MVVHVSNLIVLGKFPVSHISCWTILGGLSSNGTAQHTALADEFTIFNITLVIFIHI